MPFYFMTLLFAALGAILTIISLFIEGKTKTLFWIGAVAAIFVAMGSFVSKDVPEPEVYSTNGKSLVDNELYFKTEWPLKVKYTYNGNNDPETQGEVFVDNIPLDRTVTVYAKASFFGIKWSKLMFRDIVVGEDEISILKPSTPGSSIATINAYLIGNRYFPGDSISHKDIKVEGMTIAGEKVVLEDYTYTPEILVEGKNEIEITYNNLKTSFIISVLPPEIVDIQIEYVGEKLRVGDEITNDMFKVTGVYEDGTLSEMSDFQIEPKRFDENGDREVSITVGGINKTATVTVYEREYAFKMVSELHTPNGGFDPTVSVGIWKENEDYSIDGITFPVGSTVTFDNWMSGLMGNGSDFAETTVSNLYFAVNEDVINAREPSERFFSGKFVVERDTNGSTTTMVITILADGNEVYQSDTVTSASTDIPAFHVNVEGVKQIIIKMEAHVTGRPFILGIAYDN